MDTGTTQTRGRGRGGHSPHRRAGSISELRSTPTRRTDWAGRIITTIAAIIALAGLASPATADDMVSNLSETTGSAQERHKLSVNDFAMPFTTGPNATGYQLTAISLDYATGRVRKYDQVYVNVYGNHPTATYLPSDTNQVAHLTTHLLEQEGPVAGVNKYLVRHRRFGGQPVTSVHLEPNTQYWVKIFAGEDATTAQLAQTASFDESGETGWTIGDLVVAKPEGTSDTNYSSITGGGAALKMKVEGTTNPEVLISISDATATEGTDATMDFVVSLSRATSGTVTVEYLTLFDGSATAATPGDDFIHQVGTLTFQPGETSKIISVPIIDDTVNDSGETFGVTLFDAIGADLDDDTATGTILNTEVLTGSFENVPAEHDGSTPFSFYAAFTTDIAIGYAAMRDHAFTVMKGDVTKARRVDGRSDRWEITVDPDGDDAVTITLPTNRACGTQGAICSKEDNPVQLSNNPSATIAGPPAEPVGAPLTASFSDVPDEHNGSDFTFQLTFSEEPDVGWRDVKGAVRVSNGSVNGASRKTQGSNLAWNVKVRPTGTGSLTITLPETTECSDSNAICTANGRQLSHSTSQRVQGWSG